MTADYVEVDVLERHIGAGKRFTPYACPIALAAREQGLKTAAMHTDGTLTITAQRGFSPAYVSRKAGKFAERFDIGKEVTPQKFIFTRDHS